MFTNQNHARSEARRLVMLLYVAIILFAAACAATPTRESTGGYVDDSTITAKIKADLL